MDHRPIVLLTLGQSVDQTPTGRGVRVVGRRSPAPREIRMGPKSTKYTDPFDRVMAAAACLENAVQLARARNKLVHKRGGGARQICFGRWPS